MHTHISECFANLEDARRELHNAVDSVPAHARDKRPAPDRWSVGEILEHLSLVERRFAAIIALRINEAMGIGLGSEESQRQGLPPDLQQMLRDRANRRTAPDAVQPTGTVGHQAAWAELERIRRQLEVAVLAADGLALSTVTHTHPVFGLLNVYQLMDFIAGHETRHAKQIRGVAESLT
jgi:hypothetical protein